MNFTRGSVAFLVAAGVMACGKGATVEAAIPSDVSLCSSGEQVLFTCRVRGKGKIASICASPGWQKRKGYIVYRYGRSGRVELSYPDEKTGSFGRFYYSGYVRPLVTRQSLRFVNNSYEYVIETNNDEEESPHLDEAFVSISGPKNAELHCEKSGRRGIDIRIADVVPCDPEGIDAHLSCPQP